MARKPARLERAGALTPRDRMWAAMRALAAGPTATAALFSAAEIAYLSAQHPDTVMSYMKGLTAAGYLEVNEAERPENKPRPALVQYRLARDCGVEAPRVTAEGKPVTAGAANDAMWAAMKVLREFDHTELARAASDERVPLVVREETAKTYVLVLWRAGYLIQVAEPVHGHSKARYRFNRAKNTGPRAPLITRDKSVMDANTGAIVWTRGDKECKA